MITIKTDSLKGPHTYAKIHNVCPNLSHVPASVGQRHANVHLNTIEYTLPNLNVSFWTRFTCTVTVNIIQVLTSF